MSKPDFQKKKKKKKWSPNNTNKFVVAIFSIERDPHDANQKAKESQDTSLKIVDLQKKLDSARTQVQNIYDTWINFRKGCKSDCLQTPYNYVF